MTKYFLTSESVSSGHPDKICDQISDAILDACLEKDIFSRVACEVMATNKKVIISGEITTKANIDYEKIARNVINNIGYNSKEAGYNGNDIVVDVLVNTQSPDIAMGVDTGGAGDQGLMFGYATNESDDYLPLSISYAHKLGIQLEKVRKEKILDYLLPDGKTQVTIEFENDKPKRIDAIVISNQHKKDILLDNIRKDIKNKVIIPIVGDLIDENTKIFINPTGNFEIGGPVGDCGLTGRKIIVDTYGGIGRHGGGAFSGKDPTKVDRSGAYIARYLAKNVVASGLANKCEIQISYAIGVKEPTSVFLDCFNTNKVEIDKIINIIKDNFDLSPKGIIDFLELRNPIYFNTSTYGHFGKNNLPWEKLNSVDLFKKIKNN